jgi:hypothetical protein
MAKRAADSKPPMLVAVDVEKFFGSRWVFGDNGFGVLRSILADVARCAGNTVDDPDRDNGVEIFGRPVLLDGGNDARIETGNIGVAAHFASGIDQQALPHLFERGFSGDGSSGLGLPICKEIIEEHGGSIRIESVPEKGTGVYFTLPCAKGETDHGGYHQGRASFKMLR